ncbi:Quinone oxidoreductase [Arcticibacter svalbardensis MN12-7]|uniref:Quinone oxidoreductase n=1 Tax=Arcticibacter svalbardensis MN12-7 TaxID=1150600 RepID=R9GPR4_9SPHI|nr:NAD(P)H-quinone oxidoreductase [Arcticibacter svalbardensis]EOR93696.1 Quinone oxidoreductase [Arcticibacter svalbardensis MN12-7]
MKAVVITKPGEPEVLQVAERPLPVCADNQVLIKVVAAGMNWPDVMQRKGLYPAPPGAPVDIPGMEVSGIIESCGARVSRWVVGDAVCVLLVGGGYAEYVVADAEVCLPVPDGWSFEEAASLPETVFTVWQNVFQRGKLLENEHFLVHGGSSGIGITAIQLAVAMGAKVYATAGTAEKCAFCEQLGAEICVNYKEADFSTVLSDLKFDVILDMIGGDYMSKNLQLLNDDGRLVFINAMKGSKVEIDIMQVMKKRLVITGSTLRGRDTSFKAALAKEIELKVWPLLRDRTFRPVIFAVFPLDEAADAHAVLESSKHIGKIVLRVS